MDRDTLVVQRLVALFVLGCAVFGFPVMAMFDGRAGAAWPGLALYLFGAWAAFIALLYRVMRRSR
jgi:hypothetical protein